MNKFNQILKNVLLFLVIFLAINYLINTFFVKEDTPIENTGIQVTTTENVALIVPHGIRQTGPAKASGRQTKPVLGAYVALVRQGEAHKIASF